MSGKDGLFTQIRVDVLDDSIPLASVLRKCVLLGGLADSVSLRDWASQELHGYDDANAAPSYRRIAAPLYLRITNRAGYNPMEQLLHSHDVPQFVREKIDVTSFVLDQGVGRLQAMTSPAADGTMTLSPRWGSVLLDFINENNSDPFSRAAALYFRIDNSAVVGVLDRIRSSLVELVAEMVALEPGQDDVPDKAVVDQAVSFIFTGERPTIHVSTSQQVATSQTAPVIVAGPDATAIGSQIANGTESTVVGSQSVTGDHNITAGADVTGPADPPTDPPKGFWARLRARGLLVALATIAAGVIAVLTYLGVGPSTTPTHSGAQSPAPPTPSTAAVGALVPPDH